MGIVSIACFASQQDRKDGNGRPDLIVSKGDFRAAVEIETGKSDPMANVKKNLKAGFQMVIIMPTSQAVHDSILRSLQAESLAGDPRIRIASVKGL